METALVLVQKDIIEALDQRYGVILVLLDMSAAFDTVDNEILLSRLEQHFRMSGPALTWMRSYLTGRRSQNNQAKHHITVIKIGDCDITPSPTVRNIGAVFDSEMSMVGHIKYTCRIAYFHLSNIASIRSCLTQKAEGASWPTAGGITEVRARQECNKFIIEPGFSEKCQEALNTTFADKITFCVTDIGLTDSLEIASYYTDVIKEECQDELSDNEPPRELSDTTPDTDLNDLLIQLCPGDCSNHGVCNLGECDCIKGYTSEDCSVSVTAAPLVAELTNLGLCDMASSDCETFSVYGDNFVDSADLKCHYEKAQVTGLPVPSGSPSFVGPAEHFSDDQVTCNLAGRSMVPYRVRVRNKDADSSDSRLFLPYHSACHKCSISGDVGTCTQVFVLALFSDTLRLLLDNVCYENGDKNPSDKSQVCDSTKSRDQWNEAKEGDRNGEDVGINTIVLSGLLAVGLVVAILVKCKRMLYRTADTEDDTYTHTRPEKINLTPAVYDTIAAPPSTISISKPRSMAADTEVDPYTPIPSRRS
ncbi:hypothetical protein LSAT2_015879 [Lamellibrachia satsuma]|nr:hypothetical protein LSAT2_015879 [Lamellibrachia satsuma]